MLTLEEFTAILDRVAPFVRCSECQHYLGPDRWCPVAQARTKDRKPCRTYAALTVAAEPIAESKPAPERPETPAPATTARPRAFRLLVAMPNADPVSMNLIGCTSLADAWTTARHQFGPDRVLDVREAGR